MLVNGKRRHASSLINLNGSVGRGSVAVDLNTIPPLAIERIEVLRDGASSQYGSDAIAGVINIQLRRAEGGRAQMTYGRYITDMDDVPQVTGVATDAGGLPIVVTPAAGNQACTPSPHATTSCSSPRPARTATSRTATPGRSPPISACRSAPAAISTSPPR